MEVIVPVLITFLGGAACVCLAITRMWNAAAEENARLRKELARANERLNKAREALKDD